MLSESVLCAPGSEEKECCVRPCGVRQARKKKRVVCVRAVCARLGGKVVVVVEAPTY